MTIQRRLFTWKFFFYDGLLPLIRRLDPARGDAVLGAVGRVLDLLRPGRRRRIEAQVKTTDCTDDRASISRSVAANVPRYLARDYLLDGLADAEALARFDVEGAANLDAALAAGRGVVLVGSHFGAHLAGLHWLDRRGVDARFLVQRPGHVSRRLRARFDRSDGEHPQPKFFLRRAMPLGQSADRLLRAHAALRSGLAVYLNGDIPWTGPNARLGQFLGVSRRFLAIWADLAVLASAPAVFVTCTHRRGGRYQLEFSSPRMLAPGDESTAVAAYLARLETAVRDHPADAVPHLSWPCFGPGEAELPCQRRARVDGRLAIR